MRTCGLLVFGVAALAAARPVAIGVEGKPAAVIVLGAHASAGERSAAEELRSYIQKSTGASLPVSDTAQSGPVRLLVGRSACPPGLRPELDRIHGDGYLIESQPDASIVLAGNGTSGTSYAVYDFLGRYAGVRWLWPGDLGEIVPEKHDIAVERASVRREPAYLWRDLGPGGALWGPFDKWTMERKLGVTEEHQRLQRLWEKRNGFGGLLFYGGHAFGEILPPARYGPTHPEYFALVNGTRRWEHFDGKHGAQPCTSNPDVIRITEEYANRFFDEHPAYDAFAISLNDGGGFCECDRCRRLDTGAVQKQAGDPEAGQAGTAR